MDLIRFIYGFLRKQWWIFLIATLLGLIWTFETLFWPYFLGKVVEILTLHDSDRMAAWPSLKVLLLAGAGLFIAMVSGFRVRDLLQAYAFPKLEADIRITMFDHIQRHSPSYFNEHFSGNLANKINDMVTTVSTMLRTFLMLCAPGLLSCLIVVATFGQISTLLAVIVSCWIVAHFALVWFFTIKCSHYSYIHGEVRSTLIGKIVDSLTNNLAVNLFYRFEFEKAFINRYSTDEQKANQAAQMYSMKMFTALSIAIALELIVLMGYITHLWLYDAITTGQVVQLFYTTFNLYFVVWIVADQCSYFFQWFGIAKQAMSVMHYPQDLAAPPHATPLVVSRGEIVFDTVSFCYGEKSIFENKNLRIEAGERVGLVGYSGAGKSTFVSLILRFFPLKSGRIFIDGQDIWDVTLESLRTNIALIPQDPILFHRSLEENIRYGRVDATHDQVVEAARLAHCDTFIRACPNGYDSLVGERGTKLSGGEKQRIAIARAMLVKAPILILDEATSSLDSVTERYIQDSLTQLMEQRTTIVVAHRLSTLAKMDRILVFDQGKIIEEGSHQQLLDKQGHYAHMWHMQSGGFLPDSPS